MIAVLGCEVCLVYLFAVIFFPEAGPVVISQLVFLPNSLFVSQNGTYNLQPSPAFFSYNHFFSYQAFAIVFQSS